MSWNMQFLNFFLHAYNARGYCEWPVNMNDGSGISCKWSDHYKKKLNYVLRSCNLIYMYWIVGFFFIIYGQ